MRVCSLLFVMLFALSAQSADMPGIAPFIDEMVTRHHFKREELERAFAAAERRQDVIDALDKPATTRPWLEYRSNFINPKRINGGLQFWITHAEALRRAEQQYGVPQEIIVGIIGVETLYGRHPSRYRTLDTLITLAFDYPRRSDFFRRELEEYLLLVREQGFDLLAVKSSFAGALGIPQFMPSNYRRFAVDYNGNGKVDIMNEPEDAIGSVANYFMHYGWRSGEPVAMLSRVDDAGRLGNGGEVRPFLSWKESGVVPLKSTNGFMPPANLLDFTLDKGNKEYWLAFPNFTVIMRYNNSSYYAMSVLQLAEAVRNIRY